MVHDDNQIALLKRCKFIGIKNDRFSVLKGTVEDTLKQMLQTICNDYNYYIKALEVMPDHIHIFIDVPQTVAPYDVA